MIGFNNLMKNERIWVNIILMLMMVTSCVNSQLKDLFGVWQGENRNISLILTFNYDGKPSAIYHNLTTHYIQL